MKDNTEIKLTPHLAKLLIKEQRAEATKQKISQVKTEYEKFEKGEIRAEDFKNYITNDMGIPSNPKLERILSASHTDGKTFKDILTSLDLLNKKEGALVREKRSPNYTNQYMRYKRVLDTPQSKASQDDPLLEVKSLTSQLIKRSITADAFRESLREKGINPSIQSINKVIKEHEAGKVVKFNELYGAVVKHKDDKVEDPQYEIKTKKFFAQSLKEEHKLKSMRDVGNGSGQLAYMAAKRRVNPDLNSYHSNKEVFDWELSTLKKIKSGDFNAPSICKNNPNHKTVYLSNVFNADSSATFESPKKNKDTSSAFFGGSGDILAWKGSVNNGELSDKGPKRRNPNELRSDDREEKKQTKIFKLLTTSKENVLSSKFDL